jgi:hypothetical protein
MDDVKGRGCVDRPPRESRFYVSADTAAPPVVGR